MRYCLLSAPGYRVGDDGSVWCCLRRGRFPVLTPYWRRLQVSPSGRYLTVKIGGQTRKVHELVLSAFVGPCPPGMECRHLDGDGSNNRLSNLAWGTHAENYEDTVRLGRSRRGKPFTGRVLRGVEKTCHKLSEEQVRTMRQLRRQGWTSRALAEKFGVARGTAWAVSTGHTWQHLRD